jgi:hypothetical protein
MLVEILYVHGCPGFPPARALVERVGDELGIDPAIRLTEVCDDEEAQRLAFLGSPSVRVDGVDVEPGAAERAGYAVACRMYPTAAGTQRVPDAEWVRRALTGRRRLR